MVTPHFLLEANVFHRRFIDRDHQFTYRALYFLLDLTAPDLGSRFRIWSRFRRHDYLGPATVALPEAARQIVKERLGFVPNGKILLLTQLRTVGFLFNPVSFYFCHDQQENPVALIADVQNTPWNERHQYVVPWSSSGEYWVPKAFHVSPFLQMEYEYRWIISLTKSRVSIAMENWHARERSFTASIQGQLVPGDPRNFIRLHLRNPFTPQKSMLAIYWQAFNLWRKGVRYFPHPAARKA